MFDFTPLIFFIMQAIIHTVFKFQTVCKILLHKIFHLTSNYIQAELLSYVCSKIGNNVLPRCMNTLSLFG